MQDIDNQPVAQPTQNTKSKFEQFASWVNLTKAIVEIFAIVVAGIWTYDKFVKTELPTLQRNFKFEGSSLDWSETNTQGMCMAELILKLTNGSKTSIAISRIRRRSWYVDAPKLSSMIQVFDLNEVMDHQKPIHEIDQKNHDLVGLYSPDQTTTHALSWLVAKKDRSYTLFRVDLYGQDEGGPTEYYYTWGPTCGVLAKSK